MIFHDLVLTCDEFMYTKENMTISPLGKNVTTNVTNITTINNYSIPHTFLMIKICFFITNHWLILAAIATKNWGKTWKDNYVISIINIKWQVTN